MAVFKSEVPRRRPPANRNLRSYTLRHIGPKAVVFPDTIGQSFTVLNRTDMVARPLPVANIPDNAHFASGTWNGRLFDAGDASIVWPNKEASDGPPWRSRFDPTDKLQWPEVYVDEYLEGVYVVTKVTPDMTRTRSTSRCGRAPIPATGPCLGRKRFAVREKMEFQTG